MTRIFTEGAEAGDMIFWTSISGNGAGTATATTAPRIGGRHYIVSHSAGLPSLKKSVPAVSEFYVRYAAYFNSNNTSSFRWYSSTTELGSIRRNTTSGCIDIYTGTGTLQVSGTTFVQIYTYYVFEVHVKIDDSVGVIEFKIDGVLQPGYSGDTKPGAETTVDVIGWVGSTNTNSLYLDDMALNDTAGATDNSWCGDGHIYGLIPNGNGNTNNFVGSDSNSTDNYLLVDEIPNNGDTDYVQSATPGDIDLYTYADLPALPANSTIGRVVVETKARELTADGDSLQLGIRSGTTESFAAGIVVGVSYAKQVVEFTTNPDTSAAWTESDVNSIQAGVKIP